MRFTEEQIREIFGSEAAEDENISRFKEYYFKSDVYSKIHNDLALRIMVGHKGIGKSAAFRMSYLENMEKKRVVVWLKPDDIMELAQNNDNFLQQIRDWKKGLTEIILSKILDNLELEDHNKVLTNVTKYSGKIIGKLAELFENQIKESINKNAVTKEIINKYVSQKRIYVYIDDLDRGWTGAISDIKRISALLNAARDLTNDNDGLCIRISLRSDVFFLVRTSDESTDKIENNVIWYSWTQHELLVMLAKRIQSFNHNPIQERILIRKTQREIAKCYNGILEERFYGSGKWNDVPTYKVLASMIRRRPRDLIKLCSLAARTAFDNGHEIINTDDFLDNFDYCSQERIQDTVNEYRSELPDIQRLLMGMKPSNRERRTKDEFVYTSEELIKKIEIITDNTPFMFSNGVIATPQELAGFMYKINFLVARKKREDDGNIIDRKYFEDNKYLSNAFVDFGYQWEVHPAFRWALYPDGGNMLFNSLCIDGEI